MRLPIQTTNKTNCMQLQLPHFLLIHRITPFPSFSPLFHRNHIWHTNPFSKQVCTLYWTLSPQNLQVCFLEVHYFHTVFGMSSVDIRSFWPNAQWQSNSLFSLKLLLAHFAGSFSFFATLHPPVCSRDLSTAYRSHGKPMLVLSMSSPRPTSAGHDLLAGAAVSLLPNVSCWSKMPVSVWPLRLCVWSGPYLATWGPDFLERWECGSDLPSQK